MQIRKFLVRFEARTKDQSYLTGADSTFFRESYILWYFWWFPIFFLCTHQHYHHFQFHSLFSQLKFGFLTALLHCFTRFSFRSAYRVFWGFNGCTKVVFRSLWSHRLFCLSFSDCTPMYMSSKTCSYCIS